ncbi:MAG: T9SS type A sorting domain-containing protein [Bacteroidales bacterium]|nr:T9SS type A sorting domain-containing protein [Bacteroidales bacterium]MCF8454282.1 T9SS type A sorting domain-containing protein [Bacteroidales bacterium]
MEGSPYYIDGHISIADGQTLTIEPGVMVGIRGPWHFSVQGCVLAEGTVTDTILFTRSNPNIQWDGFDYYETPATNDSSKFDYCIFEHGYGYGGSNMPTSNAMNCGGIFYLRFMDKLEIKNSEFRYNESSKQGYYPPSGGAMLLWNSDPFIQKCKFYENNALYGGAMMMYKYSNPVISNCLFYDNQADKGGALCFFENGNGIIINNTLADNSANLGGALYFTENSNPKIINTLIWGNTAQTDGNQVHLSIQNSPGFYYCDIEGGQLGFSGTASSGDYLFNIDADPLFWGDTVPYRIIGGSPCIEAGTPDSSAYFYLQYLPACCFKECDRILDDKIDIGAYEQSILEIDEQVKPAQSIIAYPNPFSSTIYINFKISEATDVSIQIYNNLGQMVDVLKKGKMQPGKYSTKWNAEVQPQGIYFIHLQSGDEIFTQKIIKQ